MTSRARRLSLIVAACGTLMPLSIAGAQLRAEKGVEKGVVQARHGALKLTTERVVIFKDGYSLIVKHASGSADDTGQVWTDKVPDAAILGCFWATTDSGEALSMRAEWVETTEEKSEPSACVTIVELLRASTGGEVTLHLVGQGKAEREVSGKLVEVLELPPTKPPTAPEAALRGGEPAAEPAGGRTVREIAPESSQFVVLDTGGAAGRVVLPVGQVQSISGAGVRTHFDRKKEITERTKRLSFAAAKTAPGQNMSLRLFYFTPGVRWIPTYRIENVDSEEASLALQAEILNEFEDLTEAQVDLVAGVPNFRFKGIVSPLSLERTLRNSLISAAPDIMGRGRNQLSNAMFSQRAGEWRDQNMPASQPAAGAEAPVLTSGGEQDLYVYRTGRMSLTKGGRASLPLWATTAPLRHIYTLHIEANQEARPDPQQAPQTYGAPMPDEGFAGSPISPLKLLRHQVWHQLELTNTGDKPWTTGPALVLKESLPIAQELLTYTGLSAKTRLPLTVAVDMRGDHKEEELERRANALQWNHSNFGLIRKRGTVTIKNLRKEPSSVCVTVAVPGKAEEATDAGAIVIDDFRQSDWMSGWQHRVNNHSDVSWEFDLKPGETRVVSYTYSFYVP